MSIDALNAACRGGFDAFAMKAFSILEPGTLYEYNWHIGCIAEHLEASNKGLLPWLIINIPPRALKSVLVAQLYVAWVLGNDPSHQFICAAYAHSLAERNVMGCRRIMQSDWYLQCFPRTRLSQDQNQKDFFTTTMGGQYKGTGIGGAITGYGCNTLIVDDPINPKEGASDTIRATAIAEIRSTLFSRFNDRRTAKFIMIMQRVHDGDPTGELYKDGRYYLLKIPAEARQPVSITLGDKKWEMKEGELLTPRLSKADLDELRIDLGEYNFSGQYLQEPVPVGGGEFKPEWIEYYSTVKPKTMNLYILVDAAGGDEVNKKKKKTSDFTAMMVVGLGTDNNYYLLDIVRDRLNPTERVEMLFILHRKWNTLCGKPPKVGYEKYGLMTDTHYIRKHMDNENYRFPLVELGGKMMKEERIRRLIPDMQRGRWYFPAELKYIDNEGRVFDLVSEIIKSEMPTFPRARFDDGLDALSRIKDEDLQAVFPSPKVKKPLYEDKQSDSWVNW